MEEKLKNVKFEHGSVDVVDTKDNFGVYITQGDSCISVFNDKHQGTCICVYDDVKSGMLPAIAISAQGVQFRDDMNEPVVLTVKDVIKLQKLLKAME